MTETKRKTWIVDESGAGDYRTLTRPCCLCGTRTSRCGLHRHGIYEERPFIELADYVIEGEYRNATVITASVGGRDRGRARSRPAPSAAQRCFWAAARPLCAT